jgi:hypothetical protein
VHGSCILEEDSFEYLFLALHLMLIESYEKERFNSGGRQAISQGLTSNFQDTFLSI